MASEIFDVICTSPFVFNEELFEFWIEGLSGKMICLLLLLRFNAFVCFQLLLYILILHNRVFNLQIMFFAYRRIFKISFCFAHWLSQHFQSIVSWINIVDEVALKLQSQPDVEVFNISLDILMSSVADQYAQFTLLESELARPDVFITYSYTSNIDWKLRRKIVERLAWLIFRTVRKISSMNNHP